MLAVIVCSGVRGCFPGAPGLSIARQGPSLQLWRGQECRRKVGLLFAVTAQFLGCRAAPRWNSSHRCARTMLDINKTAETMKNAFKCCLVLFVLQTVSGDSCSLEISPSRVVVGFGEPVSVSCVASRPVRVLGWESAIGALHTQHDLTVQWRVDSLIDWIEEPICYGVFFTAPRQCEEKLNLVLYKTPDSISISLVNHTGPLVEGREYQLLCEVQNIAPVQYLTLRWYRGQTEVYTHTFSELSPATPVQVSSTLLITPGRMEHGAPYRCEATLELGPEGPQPPPRVKSELLDIVVHYPADLFSPELEVLELGDGEEIALNCSAGGNPPPLYSWSTPALQDSEESLPLLTARSLGTYTCTASNILGKSSKQFIIKPKSKGV